MVHYQKVSCDHVRVQKKKMWIFWVSNWLKIGQIGQKPYWISLFILVLNYKHIVSLLLMCSVKKSVLENDCL